MGAKKDKRRKESDTIKANGKVLQPHSAYKPEYCEMIKKHLEAGLSVQTFGGVIGVARSTIYKWIDDIPEFKTAKEIGIQKAQEFFEKRLLAKIAGQDLSKQGVDAKLIDTSCLIFALKTRFHETYGEKKEEDNQQTILIQLPDAKATKL